VGGLARHQQAAPGAPAERAEQREDAVRGQAVRVDDRPGGRIGFGHLDLEHGHRARRLAPLRGVHQDEQLTAVEQVVGQVHAADAEVLDLHAIRHRAPGQQPDHLNAERVVAQEHVAHARDQRPPARGTVHWAVHWAVHWGSPASYGSTSSGMKYRKRPCAMRRSSSGWPCSATARYGLSSTSCSTAWTSATRPTRNMSCASVRRAPSRSRTRLPRAIAPRTIRALWVSGYTEASASGSHHGTDVSPASVSTGGSAAG